MVSVEDFYTMCLLQKEVYLKCLNNSCMISGPGCCGSSGACLDCMLRGIKSQLGLGFFPEFFMFQLHISDSLYSRRL